jgi:copper(I)-binding protein
MQANYPMLPALALSLLIGAVVSAQSADDHAHDEAHSEDDHEHAEEHAEDDHGHEEDEAAHAFEAGGIKVVHPWMNATLASEALIFMEIENAGTESVTILGAEVSFADTAELVGFLMVGGEGSYEPLPGVPVAPERKLDLAPNALAIRASGLTASFTEGDAAEITLLTSAGPVPVTVEVEAEDATQHSHASHAH